MVQKLGRTVSRLCIVLFIFRHEIKREQQLLCHKIVQVPSSYLGTMIICNVICGDSGSQGALSSQGCT